MRLPNEPVRHTCPDSALRDWGYDLTSIAEVMEREKDDEIDELSNIISEKESEISDLEDLIYELENK